MKLTARVEIERAGFALRADVEAESGLSMSIVGPNGAGKSTLLRALAGLEPLDAGAIRLGDRVLDAPNDGVFVPPEARRVAVVFQDHRLFPHLDACDNVAFGLRARGIARDTARQSASEWLARVGASDLASQRPASLSGGEAQRVAIARALATEPDLLLLDEPLAAIDAASKPALRRLLAEVLRARTGPSLVVTHDAVEAAVLGERVTVLEGGAVIEVGTPAALAAEPRSAYVADHVGLNVFRGVAAGHALTLGDGAALHLASACEGAVTAVVHPRAVSLHPAAPAGSPRNVWAAPVVALAPYEDRVRVRIGGPIPIVAEVTSRAAADLGLSEGRLIFVSLKATEIAVVPG